MTFEELAEIYQKSEYYGKVPFAEWCYEYGRESMYQELQAKLLDTAFPGAGLIHLPKVEIKEVD